jgi:CRISPR/Cas system CMR subunit Cmr4 (Cas7 group RAMP superfamily)
MGLLEAVIVAIGGQTLLIGAFAYLTKSLLSQWLAKEMKRHESDLNQESKQFELELKGKYDAAAERLKSELQLHASEHHVRFTKLHERRADVIAEAYRLLVEALWDVEAVVAPLQVAGDKPVTEKYNIAHNKLVDF